MFLRGGLIGLLACASVCADAGLSVEYLYWKQFNASLAWTSQTFGNRVTEEIYNPDYRSGVGVEGRWSCLSARYRWLQSSDTLRSALTGSIIGMAGTGGVTIPGTVGIFRTTTRYHLAQFLTNWNLLDTLCFSGGVLAGVEFVYYDRSVHSLLVVPGVLFRAPGDGRNSCAGAGPSLGLFGQAQLWRSLRFDAELLVGHVICSRHVRTTRSQPNPNFTSTQRFRYEPATEQLLAISFRAGGAWQRQCGRFRPGIALGWEHHQYRDFNYTKAGLVAVVFDEFVIPMIAFGGPYLGATLEF